jgi:hypothetical protein
MTDTHRLTRSLPSHHQRVKVGFRPDMTDGPHLIGNGSSPPVQPIRGSSKPSNALDPSQPLKPTLPGHSAYHPERLFLPRSRHSTVQSGLYFAAILIAHLLGSRELLPGLARLWMWISLLSPHRKAASQLLMEQVSFGGSERVLQARFEARKQIAERPLGANRG